MDTHAFVLYPAAGKCTLCGEIILAHSSEEFLKRVQDHSAAEQLAAQTAAAKRRRVARAKRKAPGILDHPTAGTLLNRGTT